MAKKIRLDFSKVEERSGINTKRMPEGLHAFKIVGVEDKEAQDGTDMYVFYLVPEVEKYKTRRFPYYCKLQQNQFWKLRDLMVAAGVLDASKAKGKAVNIDPNKAIGKVVAGEVEDETGQYEGRSTLANIYGLDILDEDSTGVEDDDEEYDDEADEAEEEYEDDVDEEEEADEDELREEIEALTLPALRKRAKGLGIDTDGVKKDELVELVIEEELGEGDDEGDEDEDDLDDEDLDDEELEDEEFEDDEEEEEEPEPAPRRRAAARKPAAKAPARRTVKRR
ncbi:hypothetical protein SEA_MANDALORIAN_32 [Microbacterium phage Mandalorian]|nr:hypothetical protein SEA_MANDALORIAN_32 [Microbacterium phage Mandalorian]